MKLLTLSNFTCFHNVFLQLFFLDVLKWVYMEETVNLHLQYQAPITTTVIDAGGTHCSLIWYWQDSTSPAQVAQWWACQTHDLVVVSLIPCWGELSFRCIFACRSMWEKQSVALEIEVVLVLVWESLETHGRNRPPWYDLSCYSALSCACDRSCAFWRLDLSNMRHYPSPYTREKYGLLWGY